MHLLAFDIGHGNIGRADMKMQKLPSSKVALAEGL